MGAENSSSVTLRVDHDYYQKARRNGFVNIARVDTDYEGSEQGVSLKLDTSPKQKGNNMLARRRILRSTLHNLH